MAALHAALQTLGPIDFSTVPLDSLPSFLQESLTKSQLLIDSVPINPPDTSASSPPQTRPRANTTASSASNSSEISISSARSAPPIPEHAALQKEWGKPIKLSAKDNPLGMSVYKMSGKDGKGAWFARRSVHEGLMFERWKTSMQREFPETMEVQGGPGEGNIRGIGGERRVEHRNVEGVGQLEVYHLSAQFPGPTAPRDFVTLLLTSDAALPAKEGLSQSDEPRHYMVISKPCVHPDCPPREGYIRGQYESIEFIREIPLKQPKKTSRSSIDLRGAALQSAKIDENTPPAGSTLDAPKPQQTGRPRGKTTSIVVGSSLDEPRNGSDAAPNPVEWIMITRSDPGGNVPRFLVERGTPGSIVADAGKFLDWACQKEHAELEKTQKSDGITTSEQRTSQHETVRAKRDSIHDALHANGHLAGLTESEVDKEADTSVPSSRHPTTTPQPPIAPPPAGYLQSMTSAVSAGLASITPAVIADHLPLRAHSPMPSSSSIAGQSTNALSRTSSSKSSSTASVTSALSYETAASFHKTRSRANKDVTGNSDSASLAPPSSSDAVARSSTLSSMNSASSSALPPAPSAVSDPPELAKAYAKLTSKMADLDSKLARARASTLSKPSSAPSASATTTTDSATTATATTTSSVDDSSSVLAPPQQGSKEAKELAKAEERDRKERIKARERYDKEGKKLRDKMEKEKRKEAERVRRANEKEEKGKLVDETERLRKERDALRVVVGELQRENTELVARLGRMEGGGKEKEVGMVVATAASSSTSV